MRLILFLLAFYLFIKPDRGKLTSLLKPEFQDCQCSWPFLIEKKNSMLHCKLPKRMRRFSCQTMLIDFALALIFINWLAFSKSSSNQRSSAILSDPQRSSAIRLQVYYYWPLRKLQDNIHGTFRLIAMVAIAVTLNCRSSIKRAQKVIWFAGTKQAWHFNH